MATLCRKLSSASFKKCYKQVLCTAVTKYSSVQKETLDCSTPTLECSSEEAFFNAKNGLKIINNFTTESEESTLIKDVEPQWRRMKYQAAHWDNAIQSYRETESVRWSKQSLSVISRMKSVAFEKSDILKSSVHVLDLSPSGFIKPHVDSIKFCGRVICGLSLLSPCVMKFVKTDDSDVWFKALLDRRSLYIMQDCVRYDFTHEVLQNSESYFQEKYIDKGRRISVLCRSEPQSSTLDTDNSIFKSVVVPLE